MRRTLLLVGTTAALLVAGASSSSGQASTGGASVAGVTKVAELYLGGFLPGGGAPQYFGRASLPRLHASAPADQTAGSAEYAWFGVVFNTISEVHSFTASQPVRHLSGTWFVTGKPIGLRELANSAAKNMSFATSDLVLLAETGPGSSVRMRIDRYQSSASAVSIAASFYNPCGACPITQDVLTHVGLFKVPAAAASAVRLTLIQTTG